MTSERSGAPTDRRGSGAGGLSKGAAVAWALGAMLAASPPPPATAQIGGGSAEEAGRVRAELDRILAGGRFQTDLPGRVIRAGGPAAAPPRPPSEQGLSLIARILLIGVAVAAGIFILRSLIRPRTPAARNEAARPGARNAAAAAKAKAPPSAAELADAEAAALAAAKNGDFEEAIHLLLLGAIGRLGERDAKTTRRSYTSREILSRAFQAEGEARTAMAALVLAVEISRFGGQGADKPAFERCLDAYRALRRALTASGRRRGAAAQTA